MKIIRVRGGKPLRGEISVSGSKNAALPIIFSCILINGVSEIENLPDIGDTRVALDILRGFGASVLYRDGKAFIDTRSLHYEKPPEIMTSSLRASTYLLGACLGRFGVSHISTFGGCNFQHRPIDMHIDACISLGCRVEDDRILGIPVGGDIHFEKRSVGATVNAILFAVGAKGISRIFGAAREPHIECLIDFLNSAGASITREDQCLLIEGRELQGGKIRIIPDMIEAGSYLALGLANSCEVRVKNCPSGQMASVYDAFYSLGAEECCGLLHMKTPRRGVICARPYPFFPTDLQPIFAPIMAAYLGGSITDLVWHGRFGYLEKLEAFGVRYTLGQSSAEIYPSVLSPASVTAPDLRGGFACLMCALMTDGESSISSAEIILRGYENLPEKLSALGADIDIENT